MDTLVQQVQQLSNNADASVRHQISRKLRELAATVETPRETMTRYAYSYANSAVCQTAVDLDLFNILANNNTPLTADTVAEKSGADPLLTKRLLRFLASALAVTETGENAFAANNTTKILASLPGKTGIRHGFYFLDRCFQELPGFLKGKNYVSTTNAFDTPFHTAFKTDQHALIWMQSQRDILGNFLGQLPCLESPQPWTAAVPLVSHLQNAEKDAPLFVDVSGGPGFQCAAFKKAIGDEFKGKIILQDLPQTLDQVPPQEGVEKMAQNFFEGQAVKGAAIYYLRNVLHGHPDERCLEILKHQTAAMGPRSILLINELIIPDVGASIMATQIDINMMVTLGALERAKSDWVKLLDKADMDVIETYQYDPEMGYGIIEAVPRHRG